MLVTLTGEEERPSARNVPSGRTERFMLLTGEKVAAVRSGVVRTEMVMGKVMCFLLQQNICCTTVFTKVEFNADHYFVESFLYLYYYEKFMKEKLFYEVVISLKELSM